MGAGARRRPRLVFLHGYATPEEPGYEALREILDDLGIDLWYAVAPKGRVDPFNESGGASWFRYSSDHTKSLPVAFDRPDMRDVEETLRRPVVAVLGAGAPRRPRSLLEILELAREAGRRSVMLCGESQGGVMASLLAAEHLRRGRDKRLLGVFLLRSAPDPLTWGAWPSSPPDSKPPDVAGITWGAFVGESDEIFPEAFVRYALSPVRGAHFSVAKGVTHYDAERSVYEAAMASFARWARQRL